MRNIVKTFIILFLLSITACSESINIDKFEIEIIEKYCAGDEGYVSITKSIVNGIYNYKVICKNGIVKKFYIGEGNNQ